MRYTQTPSEPQLLQSEATNQIPSQYLGSGIATGTGTGSRAEMVVMGSNLSTVNGIDSQKVLQSSTEAIVPVFAAAETAQESPTM